MMRISIGTLLLAFVVLVACDVGGARASSDPTPEPTAPVVANAPPSIQDFVVHVFRMDGEDPPTTVWFWGRFHPVLVHLPIGLLIGLLLLELWAAMLGVDEYQRAAVFLAGLAAIVSVLTTVSGFLLSLRSEYDPVLLFGHTWLGFATTVLAFLVWFGKRLYNRTGDLGVGTIYYLTLLATVAVLSLGAYFGLQLTHGSGYFTQYVPESFRTLFEPSPEAGADESAEPEPPESSAPRLPGPEGSSSSAPSPQP